MLVPVDDTLSSRGGLSDLRLGASYKLKDRTVLGGAFHIITGSNRLESHRTFADSQYLPVQQSAELSYAGVGIGVGVVQQMGSRLWVAAIARGDSKAIVDRDSARVSQVDLPYTLGAAVRWQASSKLDLAGHGIFRTWSGANSDLLASGGTGAENTFEAAVGGEYVGDPRRPLPAPDSLRCPLRHAAVSDPARRAAQRVRRVARQRDPVRPGPRRDRSGRGASLALRRRFQGAGVRDLFRGRRAALKAALPRARSAHYLLPMVKRVYIETYGCQMNVADSELMFGLLGREGYERAAEPDDADVLLVNTCAVRDNAEQRVIGRVGELQRYKRAGGVLGVVGCMAQRLGPDTPGPGAAGGPGGRSRCLPQPGAAHRSRGVGTAADRHRVPFLGALRGRARGAGEGSHGVRDGTARLRLPLHLLYRAADPGAGAQPPAGGCGRGRCADWRSREPPKSRCWGRRSTRTTTVSTISPTCCAP